MTQLKIARDRAIAPFEQMIDEFFNQFSNNGFKSLTSYVSKASYPKLDIFVHEDKYIVEASVPGVLEEDIKVELLPYNQESTFGSVYGLASPTMVKISGKMSTEHQYTNAEYEMKEMKRSQFERAFVLPDYIHGDPVASLERGILKLIWTLPESVKPVQPKVINLKKS